MMSVTKAVIFYEIFSNMDFSVFLLICTYSNVNIQVHKKDWVNPEHIAVGQADYPIVRWLVPICRNISFSLFFSITPNKKFWNWFCNRSVERLREQWTQLPKDDDGNVIRRPKDYATRFGIGHKCVTLRDLERYTVTHKYIHWINFVIKILVHLRLNHWNWDQTANVRDAIKVFCFLLYSIFDNSRCNNNNQTLKIIFL